MTNDTTPATIGADARSSFIRWYAGFLLSDEMHAAHVWDNNHISAQAWRAALASAAQPAGVDADRAMRAQAAPAFIDSTPELHVGSSAFESWYSDYLLNAPVHQSMKQRAHDAYAAGMGDPLVVTAPAAVAGPKEAVAYLDIGAGGYLDLGSDLSDEALRKLPKGRHMLAIVGTYGVDGYVPVAAPTTQAAPKTAIQHGGATRAAARALSDRVAEMNNVDKEDHWKYHHVEVLSDTVLVISTYLAAQAQEAAPVAQADAAYTELAEKLQHGAVASGSDGEWVSIRRYVRDEAVAALRASRGQAPAAMQCVECNSCGSAFDIDTYMAGYTDGKGHCLNCPGIDHDAPQEAPAAQGDALTQAARDVLAEVERATRKFPTWPTDPLHALAVLGEEFGELTKDMLQLTYEPHKTSTENVRTEAMQTAAMALRLFMSLERYEYKACEQHSQQEGGAA